MEVVHLYTKQRKEFGKTPNFTHVEAQVLQSVPVSDEYDANYVLRNPSVSNLDTTPHMSEHEANTERQVTKSTSMRHVEGGWPKDVDFAEQSDVNRFRKKVEKDEEYKASVKQMGPTIARSMRQNNTMDIYEPYFDDDSASGGIDHSSEPPSAKGLAVFRDPCEVKRTATSVNWHPEGPHKIAVSYSVLSFQDPRFMGGGGGGAGAGGALRLPTQSYVWDVSNPNTPDVELLPPSPLCCLKFNPKSPDTLVGGSYNGLITYYDLRRPGGTAKEATPTSSSPIEKSHHDPVYDIYWINSKTGSQCVSVSTDGQMMWWDTRRLSEPTDVIQLTVPGGGGGVSPEIVQVLGGSSLEYNAEAGPSKYLVGTEQGVVLQVNLKNRKQNNGIGVFDQTAGKHHGPVYSIQRNPCNTKCFMTVGDWTARIWMEDIRTPIMSTKYHSSYLTGGCWSPTRPGVFFVTRMDGVVDVWDYFYRQNEVAYSHKVGDQMLSCIAVQGGPGPSGPLASGPGGRLMCVGDVAGTVSLLELCESLAVPQQNERKAIDSMFEREMKQEKNLEAREKELKRQRAQEAESRAREAAEKRDGKDDKMEELLRKVDADFLTMIKEAEDDESRAVEAGSLDNGAEEK